MTAALVTPEAMTYMLAATGWLPFLDTLPLEQRLTLPDGARLLGVHDYYTKFI